MKRKKRKYNKQKPSGFELLTAEERRMVASKGNRSIRDSGQSHQYDGNEAKKAQKRSIVARRRNRVTMAYLNELEDEDGD